MQEGQINALRVPKDFQRTTGAHEILASLLLADLIGMLLMALLGGFVVPVVWWCLKGVGLWFHDSLLFSIGMLLLLGCIGSGLMQQHLLEKKWKDAWYNPFGTIAAIVIILLILKILPWGWMTIPAPIIPTYPLSHVPWPDYPTPLGAAIGAVLFLLAHLLVLRHYRKQQRQDLAYARAHPGGNLTRLVEQAYEVYERGLARFHPSPVPHLKTPPSFLYFDEKDLPKKPGRAIYWNNYHSLVISYALLAPPSEHATMLLPEQKNMLLPLLARVLSDYNSLTRQVEQVLWFAQLASYKWYAQFLLGVPLLVAHACRQRWEALERDRVLDRDRFAYWCGEAGRLLKLLRQQLHDLQRAGLADNAVPMLHERIDHLIGLVKLEERQIEELKAALPPGPPAAP